jgi:hypothetical protein
MTKGRTASDRWGGLSVEEWGKIDPSFPARILDGCERDIAFERRIAWACLGAAFLALLLLSSLAIYFVINEAPTQGSLIFGSGSVSLVGLFATSRFVYRRR